jgi:hypothetical protein
MTDHDTDPLWKYVAGVQFGVGTPINPETAVRPPEALKGYQFIARFNARDTAPIAVVDDATQAERDAQVVKLTRAILAAATENATDEQVLNLHRSYFAGFFG